MPKSRKPRTHRPKSEPEAAAQPAAPEILANPTAVFDLLYDSAGLPKMQGAPDPAVIYAFAVREIAILARVAPDLGIKLEAAKTLMREFSPKTPVEDDAETIERRRAVVEIEGILAARGIAGPEGPPIEMETVEAEPEEDD